MFLTIVDLNLQLECLHYPLSSQHPFFVIPIPPLVIPVRDTGMTEESAGITEKSHLFSLDE
ncbi:hypothetical protein HC358_04165 [Wolbachia pipientis]|uniref:Uncharacterized protein n=1 Tax=Wolbachia pipientis TaxID=955 RepID=A0A7G5CAJ7_WOLPI|nr:hypothetical protein [Wolbachia pipientis]QMV46231.1 hypothetical protein HC358_04165 [Wolbachia pipientis]